MGIQLKPSVYVSGILAGKLPMRPAVYLSAIAMGKTKLRPAVFVTCIEAAPKTKVLADTRRDLPVCVTADTRRDLSVRILADTERQVYAPVAKVEADTARTLTNDRIHDVTAAFDTRRDISIVRVCCDLQRNLLQTVKVGWDTHRRVAVPASATGDAHRTLKNRVRIFADTQVRVPFRLDCVTEEREEGEHHFLEPLRTNGIRSLSFTLGELTLSDTFQLETVQPLKIGDAIEGRLMDYHFHFLVEETSQRDLVQSVKGMYDRDALLYTSIFITVKEAQVLYYAYEIARAMGWELSFHCDNFIPSQDYEHSGMTYQDFVSSLFGWTSRLPHRQVNVFLRGNTLHVIQRGQEQGVIDITDWPHGRPTIERRLVRSVWSSGNNDSPNNPAHNEEDEEPIPFSGTISFQNITRTYRNGYLVDETSDNGYAHYAYADGYLIAKQTHNTDGSTSITHYAYATTANDYYLFCEQEHATDAIDDGRVHDRYDWKDWDNKNFTDRITYHAPLGGGWYGTTVYEDGELVGSSLSQGKSGGKASQYTIEQSNLGLGGTYRSSEDEGQSWTPIGSSEFPVKGNDYLALLSREMAWLNRKTQEIVTLEVLARIKGGVPDIQHVVDFTERIRFEGNEYFLVSNTVELTPRSLRQTIKMTRWYG